MASRGAPTTNSGYTTTNSGYATTNFSPNDYKFQLLRLQIPAVIHRQSPPDRLVSTLCKTANDYKFRLYASGVRHCHKSGLRKPFYRLQIPAMAPLVAFVRCLAKVTFGNPFPRNCVFGVTTTNSGYAEPGIRLQISGMAVRHLTTTNSGYGQWPSYRLQIPAMKKAGETSRSSLLLSTPYRARISR